MESEVVEKHTIAVFDFDGTITQKDTLLQFTKFCFGDFRFFTGLLQLFPVLVLNRLKIISSGKAKVKYFKHFFRGMDKKEWDNHCNHFIAEINQTVNPGAIEKINWHLNQKHVCVIVSASVEDWIIPWAKQNGIEKTIASKVEIKKAKITGNFTGENCNYQEKTKRFLHEFPDRSKYNLYVYGDSPGDKNLLELADYSFYRKF